MTNLEIYNITNNLLGAFNDNTQKLPVKVNFFLQKNKKILLSLAQEIEEERINIAQNYGNLDSKTGNYSVDSDHIKAAQQDLNNLFNIEQDVNIVKINYSDLDPNMELTTAQMEALMFMIE